MLSFYSFKVNTVNNKILFCECFCPVLWTPGVRESQVQRLAVKVNCFYRTNVLEGRTPGIGDGTLSGWDLRSWCLWISSIWIFTLLPNWGSWWLGRYWRGSRKMWLLWPLVHTLIFFEVSTGALAEPKKDWPHLHFLWGSDQLLLLSYLVTNIPIHWQTWSLMSLITVVIDHYPL